MSDKILISTLNVIPKQKCKPLGIVTGYTCEFNSGDLNAAFKQMRKEAVVKFDADAVLGVRISRYPKESIVFVYGTAVKFIKNK